MLWYTREASVAVYVSNIPNIWPLVRENMHVVRGRSDSYITGASRTPRYGRGSQSYGNLSSSKGSHHHHHAAPRVLRTFTTPDSDELELATTTTTTTTYALSAAQSEHSSSAQLEPDETPKHGMTSTVSRRQSRDSDERAINEAMHVGSWNGMNAIGVQVGSDVEVQRRCWDASRFELGKSPVGGQA